RILHPDDQVFLHELHQGIRLQVDTRVARNVVDKDGEAYRFRDGLVVLDECSLVNLVVVGRMQATAPAPASSACFASSTVPFVSGIPTWTMTAAPPPV